MPSDVMNVTIVMTVHDELPVWVSVFDNIQLPITCIGVLVNILTLITLMKNGEAFSDIICLLLKYQSALDAIVCIYGILLLNVPAFWTVGNVGLDTVICQLWHGQYIYWATILMSIWNLVTLAMERYMCVCFPLKYTLLTKSKLRALIVAFFVFGLIGPFGCLFQTRMDGDQCISGHFWEGPVADQFFTGFVISTFFTYYAIPTGLFVVLYGRIILQFRKRKQSALGASRTASVIDKASNELTKTAVVVTAIFIFTYSFDNWYYLLGSVGVLEYVMNSPIQKVSAFFAVLNSVVNPFVYVSLMPVYRRSLLKTFKLPSF